MRIPTVGIIAEYNPLNNGHIYQIEKARNLSHAEAVVVVLSSNFVQRGEPSLIDKWARAQTALNTGVDLVLELPVVFSAHNAGVFANAATDILGSTGIVTHLSFGLEDPDWESDIILSILVEEPSEFKSLLKDSLNKGLSFVEARATALDKMVPGSSAKLRKPNNTLALSYMTRLYQKKWDMEPLLIERIGRGYNDESLSEYSSSTAIRNSIFRGQIHDALTHLPLESSEIVKNAITNGKACTDYTNLWNALRVTLMRSKAEEISQIAEMVEGIEFKLKEIAITSSSFQEWVKKCSSKRYPLGRIRRHAIHTILGLNHWENRAFQRLGPAYIKVLAMNKKGRQLLQEMKQTSVLPIITRCGDASRISDYARKIMNYELLACELWEQLIPNGEFGKEHTRKVIIEE
ncbi:MAG: nucleotidyltransferase family protein [Synergistaceae bacterium]|nr:nucleotidyltransferase family protein [Synergistaceae bacterium]